MATKEEKRAKKAKILGAVLALPFPLYLGHLVLNESLLTHGIVLSLTAGACYVGINLLRGKTFEEIKEDIKEDIEDLKD
jgi:hypothetical protein